MAFQEHIITDMDDIPALIAAFAETVGFDRPTSNSFRHPDYEGGGPGGKTFTVTNTVNSVTVTCTGASSSANIFLPILATTASPSVGVIQEPSRLFLIGMLTPEPYVAAILECGYNLYRHLYMGFMEKIGDYTGGEVISGSNGPRVTSSGGINYASRDYTNHLFSANQINVGATLCGGVHVEHADNATPWRIFRANGSLVSADSLDDDVFNGTEAIGGFKDSWNNGYVAKGLNGLSGVAVLSPINLLATQIISDTVRFRPLGRPAGVRLINIENLEAQDEVDIGGEIWKTFAVFSKRPQTSMPRPVESGSRYRLYETSYNLGCAYRVS